MKYTKNYSQFNEAKRITQSFFDEMVAKIVEYKSIVDKLNIESDKSSGDYYHDDIIEITGSTQEELELYLKKDELYNNLYSMLKNDVIINLFIDYTEALKHEDFKLCGKLKTKILKTTILDLEEQSRKEDIRKLGQHRDGLKGINKKKTIEYYNKFGEDYAKKFKEEHIKSIKTLQKQANCPHLNKVIRLDDRNPVDYGEKDENGVSKKYYINRNGFVNTCYYCTDCEKYLWEKPRNEWIKPYTGLYGFDPKIHKKKP